MLDASNDWISTQELANIARISERNARKALSSAYDEKLWRGHKLIVLLEHGQGGKSGCQYRVAIATLPQELRDRWEAHCQTNCRKPALVLEDALNRAIPTGSSRQSLPTATSPAQLPATASDQLPPILHPRAAGHEKAERRRRIISPILQGSAPKSVDRAAMVQATADREGINPTTIRRWIRDYDAEGIEGPMRNCRADRGKRRVVNWRTWDAPLRSAGLSEAEMLRAKVAFDKEIGSTWAAAPGMTYPNVQALVTPKIMSITAAIAPDLPSEVLRSICKPPRTVIEAGRRYTYASGEGRLPHLF